MGGRDFLENLVAERAPAQTAPLGRPVRHRPAAGVQRLVIADDFILGQTVPKADLLAGFAIDFGLAKGDNLVAEFQVFAGKSQVHGRVPVFDNCQVGLGQATSNRPAAPMPPPTHMVMTA